jgi:hypothetical protein
MSADVKDEAFDIREYVKEMWGEDIDRQHAEENWKHLEAKQRALREERDERDERDCARRAKDLPIAILPFSFGERGIIKYDGNTNAVVFGFLDRRDGSGSWHHSDRFELPLVRARELAAGLRDETSPHSVELGRCVLVSGDIKPNVTILPSGKIVTIPDPETKSLTVLLYAGESQRRAVILSKGGRRKLAIAINKARARGLDASLFAEALAKLGEQ